MPGGIARPLVAAAAAMWLGALIGGATGLVEVGWVLAGFGVAILGAGTRSSVPLIVIVIGVGSFSGAVAAERREATLSADLPGGPGVLVGVATSDAVPYGESYRFVAEPTGWGSNEAGLSSWNGPAVAVVTTEDVVAAGDHVSVIGLLRNDPDLVRGDPVAGQITARALMVTSGPDSPVMIAGNAFRSRVQSKLGMLGSTPETALLKGFLIGDIAELPEADTEALRRAGLTHYVAVSGSNVALVLGAWWLVLGPIGAGNRARAITGLMVLAVFVVATRWEPSVVRAATMASLVLGGRAAGISLDAWSALGGAVAILLAVSGDLAYDVGFQLSVAATAGVLIGARLGFKRRPRMLWGLLAATMSAQIAVCPILLLHFGSVPLLAPLANLLAAPMVTVSTALAGAGVVSGWILPGEVAARVAGLILDLARVVGEWPQLGTAAVIGLALLIAVCWLARVPWVAAGVVGAVAVAAMLPQPPPDVPTVVFLDVGQGDAILLRDPSGAVVLMDGGREPPVLRTALRQHGVRHIDLLVASHGDSDHVGGFDGLLDTVPVGRIWVPEYADMGDLLERVVAEATVRGIPVDAVGTGDRAGIGDFHLDVLSPGRRYATDNDGSVVLLVSSGGRTVLLPGDVGAVAQADLGPVRPNVMLVPHHGAATTDPKWLAATIGEVAVISVGPNTYGHPAPEIVSVLTWLDVTVLTTWDNGHIAIPLR